MQYRALAGPLLGLAVGAAVFAVGGGFRLAGVNAVLWAACGVMFVRWSRLDPGPGVSGWEWGVAYLTGTVGTVAATLLGVAQTPLKTGIGFGLTLLVLGTGNAAFAAGVIVGLARSEPTEL